MEGPEVGRRGLCWLLPRDAQLSWLDKTNGDVCQDDSLEKKGKLSNMGGLGEDYSFPLQPW